MSAFNMNSLSNWTEKYCQNQLALQLYTDTEVLASACFYFVFVKCFVFSLEMCVPCSGLTTNIAIGRHSIY